MTARFKSPAVPFQVEMIDREQALSSPISALAGWWLFTQCQCGNASNYPLRLMAAERGWNHKLSAIVPRMRCSECKERPRVAALVDRGDVWKLSRVEEARARLVTLL